MTKTELLDFVLKRLVKSWRIVERELISKNDEVDQLIASGQGKDRPAIELDHKAVFNLLLDFDSFVFETRSFVDYLARFLACFHSRIVGRPKSVEDCHRIIENLISEPVDNEPWAIALRKLRHLLIHEQTPWLDVELRSCEVSTREYRPVFLLRGMTMGDPDARGVNGDQIVALACGLLSIAPQVEEHLCSTIEGVEAA